jgi:hypothetical protein
VISRFNGTQSAEYRAAVRALQALPLNETEPAYAEATCTRLLESFKKTRNLRRRSVGGHVCVNRLKGKRCSGYGIDCPSIPHGDHLSEWKLGGKTVAILSQPYGLSFDGLGETLEFCNLHDLQVSIDTYPSFHFPSAVLSLTFTRKGFYL